jgi:CRP-like cAMP-binding protein
MSNAATTKAQPDGADIQPSTKSSTKPTIKVGSVSVPKLDLSLVAHGGRLRLHPNSARMLLSDEVTPQEKEFIIKGAGSWIRVLQPLLTKHVSEALVHEVTKICATVNLIPGQFLLKQGLHAKSIFIVVSGCFRLISLGVPGIEPVESSRATSARRSFTARQEAETFGSLIDPPKSSRPSPSFASEVPVFRVATIGPGQLIGEECFSTSRIIQFSVMSESYATVLSIPVDSLLPLLSHERHVALSTICLNTLACRVQRGATGGSWYLSRRTELQGFKCADPTMEMVGTSIQNAIKPSTSGNPSSSEDTSPVNSSLPAYQIYSVDGQKFIQEQLMVCVSASANSVLSPPVSTKNAAGACNLGKFAVSDDALHAVELETPAICGHTASNPPTNGTTKPPESSSQPRVYLRPAARSSNNSGIGQFVHPSQSQTGHSVRKA